jgi:hypothetical protein
MNKKLRKKCGFDNGGQVAPDVGPRRAEPNLDQKFKKGGKSCRSMGGAMAKADKGEPVIVKKTGGSMMKRAMGGVAKERKGFPFT